MPNEIIIVDWGSSVCVSDYIRPIAKDKELIKTVRLDAVSSWRLTHAFNIALSLASSEYILKLDCESLCGNSLASRFNFTPMSYSRFKHSCPSKHSQYINGAFFSCAELLRRVNYYDERILMYGWDDSDLYARMSELGTGFLIDITPGCLDHIPQAEETRTSSQPGYAIEELLASQLGVPKSVFLTFVNRFLANSRIPWGPHSCSDYIIAKTEDLSRAKQLAATPDSGWGSWQHPLYGYALIYGIKNCIFLTSQAEASDVECMNLLAKEVQNACTALVEQDMGCHWAIFEFLKKTRTAATQTSALNDLSRLFIESAKSDIIKEGRSLLIDLLRAKISPST